VDDDNVGDAGIILRAVNFEGQFRDIKRLSSANGKGSAVVAISKSRRIKSDAFGPTWAESDQIGLDSVLTN
jgi:hypothetical protein